MRFVLAGLAVALTCVGGFASAQPDMGWHGFELTGGCQIIIPARSEMPPTQIGAWNGACNAGQPIDGQGQLRFTSRGSTTGAALVLEGAFVRGVPNGAFIITTYDDAGAVTQTSNASYSMGCPDGDAECTPYGTSDK